MGETIENQAINGKAPGRVGAMPSRTPHTPDAPPPILTKKWLAFRFGCQYPAGNFNYKRLYRLVLTVEVLAEIGYTPESVKGPRVVEFDAVASRKLIKILDL